MNYQDYIKQFVEIDEIPNCIQHIQIGTKIFQYSINTIDSRCLLEIGTITHNLYNSSYLINTLTSRNNTTCKIKRKGKIFFVNNSHGTFSKPPIITECVNNFSILDNHQNHLNCQVYNHTTNNELIINVQPYILCIFKFDDFTYTSELDYISKILIQQNKILINTLEVKQRENKELKDGLKRVDKYFI
jgi:hypothetical protein